MYHAFYGLEKDPFHVTPDPEFFYLSPGHREAYGSIVYGVTRGKGFIVITGEVGVGKTMVLRSFLEKTDKNFFRVIYVFNSNLSFEDLLGTIFIQLGVDLQTDDPVKMVNRLDQWIMKEYFQGRTLVLIIDEAQNMPVKTLEGLRLLSNLETPKNKLIQIVLAGQPEFEQMLHLDELRQLKQRVAVHCKIPPLTPPESLSYIKYRLEKAALGPTNIFTRGALKKIVRNARGIPRILNILCDNALIAGMRCQKKRVTSTIVGKVIADFEGKGKFSFWHWVPAPIAGLLILTGVFFLSLYRATERSGPMNSLFPVSESIPAEEELSATNLKAPPTPKEKSSEVNHNNPEPSPATTEAVTEDLPEPSFTDSQEVNNLPKNPFPIIWTVKKGENLFRLTKKVYGYSNAQLLNYVKEHNPTIKDVNTVKAGDRIVFPEPEE